MKQLSAASLHSSFTSSLTPNLWLLAVSLCLGTVSAQTSTDPASTTPNAQTTQVQPIAASQTDTDSQNVLTLEDLYALLEKSPAVQQARLGVQSARRNLDAASTALGLSVVATGSANYTGEYTAQITGADGQPKDVPVDADTNGTLGLQASLGVLPWSTGAQNLRAARRGLALAEAQANAAVAATRLNIAQSYLGAVLGEQDLQLSQQSLALRQRQLEITRARLNNGTALETDLLTAQNALAEAEANVFAAQSGLDNARRALETALGTSLGNVRLGGVGATITALPDPNELAQYAGSRTVDVIKAQADLQAAGDEYAKQARALQLPDLNFNLRYGPAGAGGLSAGLDLQEGTANVGYTQLLGVDDSDERFEASLKGSYVVFSPALRARLATAESNVAQARLSLSVAQQQAELEVRTSYSEAQSRLLGVETARINVEVAQRELATAQARAAAGVATADDIASAELKLTQAERNLAGARKDAQLAVIKLYNAAGVIAQ